MHTFHLVQDLLLSAISAQPGAATPAAVAHANSVWDMVMKGGWVMIPIILCSFVALTITVERLIVLRRSRIVPPALTASLPDLKSNPRRALDRLASDSSPLACVLVAAIKARETPRETRDRIVEEAGQRQVLQLRQRTRLLSALPQVATMLGLLGTVIGMIRTFTVVAASGDSLGKTERLAQGIYEAWTATAAGLVVAIPTLIAYHLVMGRIDAAAAMLDRAVNDWFDAPASASESETKPAASRGTTPAEPPADHRSDESRNGVATPALVTHS